jgi:hypothetical protein
LVSDNSETRIGALKFLEEQSKKPTLGVPALYFLEFSRQIKGEAYILEKDSVLAVLDQTVENNDETEIVEFLNKYSSVNTKVDEVSGKQITSVELDDSEWESVKQTFPHITKSQFLTYLQKGAAQYDKLNNQFSGNISYSDVEKQFISKNDVYFKYNTELYKIDDNGNLQINESFDPVGKPWQESLFQQVKDDNDFKAEKHNALIFDAIIENVNQALKMEPTKENIGIVADIYFSAKKQKKGISGESRYFEYASWFLEQKGREITRKLERMRDGQKNFDAIVRKQSPIEAPNLNDYRRVRQQISPYK